MQIQCLPLGVGPDAYNGFSACAAPNPPVNEVRSLHVLNPPYAGARDVHWQADAFLMMRVVPADPSGSCGRKWVQSHA